MAVRLRAVVLDALTFPVSGGSRQGSPNPTLALTLALTLTLTVILCPSPKDSPPHLSGPILPGMSQPSPTDQCPGEAARASPPTPAFLGPAPHLPGWVFKTRFLGRHPDLLEASIATCQGSPAPSPVALRTVTASPIHQHAMPPPFTSTPCPPLHQHPVPLPLHQHPVPPPSPAPRAGHFRSSASGSAPCALTIPLASP